jgi:hypothetical protein
MPADSKIARLRGITPSFQESGSPGQRTLEFDGEKRNREHLMTRNTTAPNHHHAY